MDDLSNSFAGINWVVSIIGAIVLSILANLLTSPVQNRLARINAKRSEKRIQQLQSQLAQIENFVSNSPTFYSYILLLIVKIVLITLIAFAVSDITLASINVAVDLARYHRYINVLYAISQFTTSLLYIIGINYTFVALRTIKRVQAFHEYKAEVERTISSFKKPEIKSELDEAKG